MSRFYVLVNSTGIQEVAATEVPKLPEIQKLVGIPGEEAFFEAVYHCYSDKSIAVLVDEEFLRKAHQPTMLTPKGSPELMVISLSNHKSKLIRDS